MIYMKDTQLAQTLGTGIYSIPDLSFILRLPQDKVRRWMNEFWNDALSQKHNTTYSWGIGKDKATNFQTLIEFYVFYQLRELKITTATILKAHEDISNRLNTRYPFATANILTDGKNIFHLFNDDTLVSANLTQQIGFKQIIEKFCKKIEFSQDNVAERFWPLGKEKKIIIDPHHQYGQPTILSTNILAETIYNLYKAGESKELIKNIYNLSSTEIDDAILLFNLSAA
jgi:uncharacterized protein (DUF433 family)